MTFNGFNPDILTSFWFVQLCNIGHSLHSSSDSQLFLFMVPSRWGCMLTGVTSHTCSLLSLAFLFGRYFSLVWVWTVLFTQVIKLSNFSSLSPALFERNFCLVWVWTVLFAQVIMPALHRVCFFKKMSPWSLELELSRSLKLECWAIPALCQFPFFGKNSTLITWVGAVIFAGKRAKSLGFFNISMRLLIALCLNCLAVIADLWFRFLKEVSFQYWTYMTKNKNSDLRHGFNHPVWTPSFFLIDRCSTNHITNIS